jgi:hypothetical protein
MDKPENELPRRERTTPQELRDWETVQSNDQESTERLKIAGGFLYRLVTAAGPVALVFVPDSAE